MKYKKSALGTWELGLDQTATSTDEVVGSLREDLYGNQYRLAKAGGTALSAGKNTVAVAIAAAVMNKACPATDVGETSLTLTIGSATYAENYFRGGSFQINNEAGEGHRYPISYSSSVTAGTSISIALEYGIKVALTASSKFTLSHSPYMATVISATITDRPTGVPLVNVDANAYYWSQTSGDGIYLSGSSAPAVGTALVLGTVDGSLDKQTLASAGSAITSAPVAVAYGTDGVDTEYKPCVYQID